MPNHKMCSSNDGFKLENYDFSLDCPSLKCGEGKLCKFSYSSWCPTCEKNSPRRRSKSETNEPCKRRCKEMKHFNSKYLKSEEYENMELEDYEVQQEWLESDGIWYEAKKDKCEYYKEHCFDCGRIRSNLCELPTTYISNTQNCNSNISLSNLSKMSGNNDKLDFINCLENSVKNYEQTIKFVEYNENVHIDANNFERKKTGSGDDKLQRQSDKLEGIQSHYNGILVHHEKCQPSRKSKCQLQLETKGNSAKSKLNDEVTDHFHSEKYSKHVSDPKQTNLKITKTFYNLDDPKVDIHNVNLNYNTGTYFDKHKDINGENLHVLYSKEVEFLREKLRELKNNAYGINKNENPISEKCLLNLKPKDEVITVLQEDNSKSSNLGSSSSKSKLITVKTKGRSANIIYKKKNSKPLLNSNSSDSEGGPSDYSDSDESINEEEVEESQIGEASSSDSSTKNSSQLVPITPSITIGSGDCSAWPVRESLFPHVPPFIVFSSFDALTPRLIPIGKKLFKWKLSTITPVLVRKTIVNSGFVMIRSEFSRESNQWLGTWGKHIKSPMFKTLKSNQKLNHFPGTFQLGRKDRLWRNFQKLILAFGYREFGFLPTTYVLPQEIKQLKHNWDNRGPDGDWWIVKPPASARGVGIKVVNKWSQLPKKTSIVVQRYITHPYLINGNKFDLRLYVLVTSFNPLRIYLYKEGLARFASVKYSSSPKDIKEKYMHLTNYSINKLSSQYTANEDANARQGHKWTLTKLMEYLAEEDGVDVGALWRNLEALVIKTMIACEPPITELCNENMNNRYNCYELFGIDVLLDSKLKPWLLEVNISPSLHSSSPLDEHVKGPMVQSMFNIAQFNFPTRLSTMIRPYPKCFDHRLYSVGSTSKELGKRNLYTNCDFRYEYLENILDTLTGDDVRHLIQAEDELRVKGKFDRIFPTSQSHKYFEFMETRYHNRLFDAWETKYEKLRDAGIRRLQILCTEKVHLKVAPYNSIHKSVRNTSPGGTKQPREPQNFIKEVFQPVEETIEKEISHCPGSKKM